MKIKKKKAIKSYQYIIKTMTRHRLLIDDPSPTRFEALMEFRSKIGEISAMCDELPFGTGFTNPRDIASQYIKHVEHVAFKLQFRIEAFDNPSKQASQPQHPSP